MRKLWILAVLMLSVVGARAQQPALIDLFDRYASQEGFTSIELGRKMMQMMSRRSQGEDPDLAHLLGGISSIRIVAAEKHAEEFVSAVRAIACRAPYRLLSSISESGQSTAFYLVDGRESEQSEFLMITTGSKENVMVDVVGMFDVAEVSRLSTLRPSK